jgi:hypothetical protein
MLAGGAQGGLISPVPFSLYVNDMPSPLHHVELALYADDTAVIAMSLKPTLFVSYLQSYLNALQRWVERLGNRHKCFQKQRDNIRECRTALDKAPTSNNSNS